jgi:peptide/nickel transport system substrate-binding protein
VEEPDSLFLYARPERGRDHILAALYDGPIDSHDYGFQPVLLTKLPSLMDGDAVIAAVAVSDGDTVVDALGRVITVTHGLPLFQTNGTITAYGGGGVSVPQAVVTFHMRPGVLWSDGEPLTADDSVFSFEVSLSPDVFNPHRDRAERTQSYRAQDATTVVWTGLPGYVDPLYFTNFWTPLPRHVSGRLTPAEIGADAGANHDPLGWGPFVLREWVRGDHLTFERNPNYFRAPEGLPRLERVTYRIVSADTPALLADVRAGECDLAPHNSAFDADAASILLGLRSRDEVRVVDGDVYEHLDFGIVPAPNYARAVGSDFFQDVRARRAFAHCLDRSALASVLNLAFGAGWEPPSTYLPANHPLRASSPIEAYLFDPARGRALLAELGWRDSDGDGTLDKDRVRLALTLAGGPTGDPVRDALMRAIPMQLRANCGLEVEVQPLTRGELEGDWPDGVVFGRRFDLALFGWRAGPVPPCELFTSMQIPGDANPGGANDTGYSSPDFDEACRQALTAWDPGVAAQFHADAQRLFARDLPSLPLFFYPRIAAAHPQVSGFALDPTSPSELWNIESLSMTP